MKRELFLCFALAPVLACEKTTTPSATPGETAPPSDPATPASGSGEAAPAEVTWSEMTQTQRKQYMAAVVTPKMKTLFQEYDASQFGGVECETCHGDDMAQKNFEMPSDSLMPLDKNDPIGKSMAYDEEVTKFMAERVVPEMASLLHTTPYDPATGQGFGCFNCHAAE